MVLNAEKYRELVTRQASKERNRARVAKHREKRRNAAVMVCNAPVMESEALSDTRLSAQDPEDQNPRADAPRLVEVRSHLKAACHSLLESNDSQYQPDNPHQLFNLSDALKRIAARDLRVDDYDGREIAKIVDAVLGARARRSA